MSVPRGWCSLKEWGDRVGTKSGQSRDRVGGESGQGRGGEKPVSICNTHGSVGLAMGGGGGKVGLSPWFRSILQGQASSSVNTPRRISLCLLAQGRCDERITIGKRAWPTGWCWVGPMTRLRLSRRQPPRQRRVIPCPSRCDRYATSVSAVATNPTPCGRKNLGTSLWKFVPGLRIPFSVVCTRSHAKPVRKPCVSTAAPSI